MSFLNAEDRCGICRVACFFYFGFSRLKTHFEQSCGLLTSDMWCTEQSPVGGRFAVQCGKTAHFRISSECTLSRSICREVSHEIFQTCRTGIAKCVCVAIRLIATVFLKTPQSACLHSARRAIRTKVVAEQASAGRCRVSNRWRTALDSECRFRHILRSEVLLVSCRRETSLLSF